MRLARILLAFGGFVLLGVSAGTSGVLLPNQLADYHVDKVVFGVTFFMFSGGYLVSGVANGWLIDRIGVRGQLALGTSVLVVMSLATSLRPPFPLLLFTSVALGLGNGILDSALNAFLTTLPNSAQLLNYLHAFFGVGALIGPILAERLLAAGLHWPQVYLVLAALTVPILVGSVILFPARVPLVEERGAPLVTALRRTDVWLGGIFLCLYVGIEVTIGNWGFSLLTERHGENPALASYLVSGYWAGLTLGRFVVNAASTRVGLGVVSMMYLTVLGVIGSGLVVWWGPNALVVGVGFMLTGFFLGPVFPSTVAVVPRLMPGSLVPTAVGLLVGASVIGGALFPYLAGALAQQVGLDSLLPYVLVLGVLQVVGWWTIARRMTDVSPVG